MVIEAIIIAYGLAVAGFCLFVTWSVGSLKDFRKFLSSLSLVPNASDPLFRITVIRTVVLLVVLIASLTFITNDPFQLIYTEEKKSSDATRMYYYNMHLIKSDISDPTRVFDIQMRLLSESFSAQVPIRVQELRVQQLSGSNVTHGLTIVLPRANEHPEDDRPEVFEYFGGVPLRLATPEEGYYRNNDQWGGWDVQYDIQGCYNIVVTTNTTALRGKELFQPDCTELNIASLEATKGLELAEQNLEVQNLVIRQNNINVAIGLYVLLITVFGIPLGFILPIISRKQQAVAHKQPDSSACNTYSLQTICKH